MELDEIFMFVTFSSASWSHKMTIIVLC